MVADPEISHGTDGKLADLVCGFVPSLNQFAVLGRLAAAKDGPFLMAHRRLDDIGIVVMAVGAPAPPRQRPGEPPPGHDLACIKEARRPAGLVDTRLELFRILEPSPAPLQPKLARRIPRQANRGRIQRAGLDVPAMLVGLATVEPAYLQLHSIEHDAGGHDAEADVRRIEPV